VRDLQVAGQRALMDVIEKGEESNEVRFGFHVSKERMEYGIAIDCMMLISFVLGI
jgi:hypothetical protein